MARPGDIYFVNQADSRKTSNPKQPADVSKDYRTYLVLGAFSDYGEQQTTILQIQTPEPKHHYKYQINATKQNGLYNDSWANARYLFTVKGVYLTRLLGRLSDDDFEEVKKRILGYLDL